LVFVCQVEIALHSLDMKALDARIKIDKADRDTGDRDDRQLQPVTFFLDQPPLANIDIERIDKDVYAIEAELFGLSQAINGRLIGLHPCGVDKAEFHGKRLLLSNGESRNVQGPKSKVQCQSNVVISPTLDIGLSTLDSIAPTILDGMSSSAGDSQFHTTHWSLIAAAANKDGEQSRAALAELCEAYWYPLYAFVRRRGDSAADAQDLVQGFFAALLEKDYLGDADQSRGRFRSFLLTAMTRFAIKEHDKQSAKKRGGGRTKLSLDFAEGERRYSHEPADNWTPERIFERRWALTLLDRTLAKLRDAHAVASKLAQFEAMKGCLTGETSGQSLSATGEQLGMTEGAVKVAVHRLRQEYRELLRAEIAQTVAAEGDVDDELRSLLAALRGD
jgi:RNA polymerase sigma factor (sigma-70 family)